MTQRLPIPGSDVGTWGDILNEFLEVSLNSDGSLRTSAISSAGGEVTDNKGVPSGYAALNAGGLVPSAQLGVGTASSSNFLRGDGTWVVPNSGSSTLASDTDVSITSPSNNQVLTYSSSAGKWENQALSSAPVASVFGRTGAVVATGGDYTASQVGALPSTDDLSTIANANPTAGNVSLNFHKLTNLTNGAASSDAAAFGQIPTSLPPNGTAGGDLNGTYPNPTLSGTTNVESIISTNTTVSGALQKSNNLSDLISASSARINLGLGNAATENVGTSTGTIAAGNDSRITGAIQSGASAGGDLTGTLPSPTVAKINGITLPSSAPSSNQVLTATSSSATSWSTPASAPVSSVFGRTGAVVSTSGDYTAAQVTNAADKSSSSNQAFSGAITAPSISASLAGVSGRFVGGTTSGAPSSGTWNLLDVVVDENGVLWVCTTAGTPGTWTRVGSVQLDAGNGINLVSSGTTEAPITTIQQALITPDDVLSGNLGYDYYFQGTSTSPPSYNSITWTWINQGSATYSEGAGRGSIIIPSSSGTKIHGIYMPVPSQSTYTVTIKVTWTGGGSGSFNTGLFLTDGTKLIIFGGSNGNLLSINYFSTSTTYSSNLSNTTLNPMATIYLQIQRVSSTSWTFLWSYDGVNFLTAASGINISGSYFTPSGIGFCGDAENSVPMAVTAQLFRVR